MKKIILALAFIATPALAQDARPILWGDLRAGMTKEEVRQFHKIREEVDVTPSCTAFIEAQWYDKKLSGVTLRETSPYIRECRDQLLSALAAKYGPATDTADVTQQNTLRGGNARVKRVRTFQSDTMLIRYDDGDPFWSVTYTLRPTDAKL